MHERKNEPSVAEGYQRAMAEVISSKVSSTADWLSPVADMLFFRRDRPTEPDFCLIEPSIVLVVQGAKRILVGADAYPYNTTNFLITSLDLPASSQVVEASQATPCLGLALKLDIQMLAELIAQSALPHSAAKVAGASIGLGGMTEQLLEPLKRLVDLVDEPMAIPVLAPLIKREIHYRLLLSDQAVLIRQIAAIDGRSHRIAKAIEWLKHHYATPLKIEELAERVQMSTPTFHHHFRQLTAMSPLQYQKWLRLNEAKRLMLNDHMDVASAAYQVGYESPSQFSREYSRLFGVPPKRDINQLRKGTGSAVAGR